MCIQRVEVVFLPILHNTMFSSCAKLLHYMKYAFTILKVYVCRGFIVYLLNLAYSETSGEISNQPFGVCKIVFILTIGNRIYLVSFGIIDISCEK